MNIESLLEMAKNFAESMRNDGKDVTDPYIYDWIVHVTVNPGCRNERYYQFLDDGNILETNGLEKQFVFKKEHEENCNLHVLSRKEKLDIINKYLWYFCIDLNNINDDGYPEEVAVNGKEKIGQNLEVFDVSFAIPYNEYGASNKFYYLTTIVEGREVILFNGNNHANAKRVRYLFKSCGFKVKSTIYRKKTNHCESNFQEDQEDDDLPF